MHTQSLDLIATSEPFFAPPADLVSELVAPGVPIPDLIFVNGAATNVDLVRRRIAESLAEEDALRTSRIRLARSLFVVAVKSRFPDADLVGYVTKDGVTTIEYVGDQEDRTYWGEDFEGVFQGSEHGLRGEATAIDEAQQALRAMLAGATSLSDGVVEVDKGQFSFFM